MNRRLGLLTLVLLFGCGEAQPVAPAETAPAPPPAAPAISEQRELRPDMFAVQINSATPREEVEKAARDLCDSRDWCKVLGWVDQDRMPRGFPMTDREVEAQSFSLTINRASGMDEAVWSDPAP